MMTGLTSDLTKRIFNMKERCIKEHGKKIQGRQLLWTIYEFFNVDPKFRYSLRHRGPYGRGSPRSEVG
eukprot:5961418-Heterocapsa_arctica.AAC.1